MNLDFMITRIRVVGRATRRRRHQKATRYGVTMVPETPDSDIACI
jgi:hypothetical protein